MVCTYQTMVAEIAYLQLNLGMEIATDVQVHYLDVIVFYVPIMKQHPTF